MKSAYRKISLLLLSLTLVLASLPVNSIKAESGLEYKLLETEDKYTAVIEKNNSVLLCNTSNGAIVVKNKTTNTIFYSNPEFENNLLKGAKRMLAASQLVLDLLDKQGNKTTINSAVESVANGGLKIYSNGEKLKCVYKFPNYKISINVYYTFVDNRFVADIPVNEILTDKSEPYLSEIKVLPYFGAEHSGNKGYIITPDGCGSVINFNSKKSPSYQQQIYGKDRGKATYNIAVNQQPALIPTLGLSYDSYFGLPCAMLLYAEKGDALATAYASAGTDDGVYNLAYFGFTYRASDTVIMMDQTSKAESIVMSEKNPVSCDNFTLSYTFLGKNQNSIIELANAARSRLFDGFEIGNLSQDKLPVYIKNYLSIRKTKYFLGIPYNGNQKLTTIEDCMGMIEDFNSLPVVMTLIGVESDGAVGGKVDKKISVKGTGGSYADLSALIEKAKKSGGNAYPMAQFTEFTKGNRNNKVLSVANLALYRYIYNLGTLKKNEAYSKISVLKNQNIVKNVSSWVKSAQKKNILSCAPISLSNEPYRSGYDKKQDRESTKDIFVDSLRMLKENQFSVLTDTSAAFAIPYSDNLQSLPISSSGFSAETCEVPFLQLILHGVKSYSVPPINLSGDINRYFLKCIETGSSLCFAFHCSEYSDIMDSELDFLSGSEYANWKKEAVKISKKLAEVMEGTVNSAIVEYEILTDTLRKVVYQNGNGFVINYGDSRVEYKGRFIEPMSYLKTDGEV